MNNISYDDQWDDSFLNRRYITYTMTFTAKTYFYGPYTQSDVIRKAIVYETVGDLEISRRNIERTYSPKAKTDINNDGQIDAADDALLTADDDFGFNEGITYL